MSALKFIKFISVVAIILQFAVGSVQAASTVISEGFAAITSDIHVKEYRKRAIENALQNIAFDREQALTSFTIIENGQMLLDQVRSTSKAGILSYKILKEEKKNKTYYVKIEAVVEDANNDGEGQIKSDFCRQTNISKIDLNVALYLDRQQFPPWMNLDINWLKSEIKKANLKPKLSFVSANRRTSSNNDLYTLFEKNDTNLDIQTLYQINLMLKLDKARNETFFVQNKKLSMAFTSEILRNGRIIENDTENFHFIIAKKFGTGIPVQNNKKIWQSQKKQIASVIISELNQRLDQLKCMPIRAKLKQTKAKYFIQYGTIDGIKEKDIFILETPETQKFYFKVADLGRAETFLELISQAGNIEVKDGHTVRIVEGL